MDLQVLERTVNGPSTPPRAEGDQDVLDALRRRDPTAAERLVTRYGERAYRLACRITRNGQDAEDVVQDAFWTVVQKIDTFRGEAAFGTWLYRIVANAAYLKLRGGKNRRHEMSLDELLPLFDERGRHAAPVADWSPRLEDPAIRTELRMALAAAIEELRADFRTVLMLRDIEGRSNVEIAATLGISIALAKTRAHRARLFLRKRLDERMTAIVAPAAA